MTTSKALVAAVQIYCGLFALKTAGVHFLQ